MAWTMTGAVLTIIRLEGGVAAVDVASVGGVNTMDGDHVLLGLSAWLIYASEDIKNY